MSAPGTPKASEAAVAAVQKALGCERDECANPNCECRTTAREDCLEHDVAWAERGCPVAVAAADAAAPHIAAQTLRDAADEAEEFATETYALDIFRKPTTADYKAINGLLLRERGHELDGVAADCYRRAIGLTAKRLRETASDIEAGQ